MSLLKQHEGLSMEKLLVQVREVDENDVVLPLKKIIRPAANGRPRKSGGKSSRG